MTIADWQIGRLVRFQLRQSTNRRSTNQALFSPSRLRNSIRCAIGHAPRPTHRSSRRRRAVRRTSPPVARRTPRTLAALDAAAGIAAAVCGDADGPPLVDDDARGDRDSEAPQDADGADLGLRDSGLGISKVRGGSNVAIANAPGRYVSTSDGAPTRSLPMSAPRRARSVASVSVGNARANNPNCSTRPSATSTADSHPIDRRRRRIRLEIEQRQRAQHARVAHRRRQLDRTLVNVAPAFAKATARSRRSASRGGGVDQRQRDAQHDGAAVAALEPLAQRVEQPRQDKRQRLEAVDRPFEIERCLELLRHAGRHERPHLFAARPPLPPEAGLAETSGELARRERCQIAEGAQAPANRAARYQAPGCRLWAGRLEARSSEAQTAPVTLSGNGASAAASSPRATTVNPARACASRIAAVDVAATAMCTPRPASAAARRSSSPIARGSPMRLPSPLMSSVTVRSPWVSTRGEKSRAT